MEHAANESYCMLVYYCGARSIQNTYNELIYIFFFE